MKVTGENNEEEKESDGVLNGKINAFQFMMNNRNRVIGRNSPGKDVDVDTTLSLEDLTKTGLKARKNFMDNWAELKGASKRKREYDEKGNIINFKLEKRAKRLKKLLKCSTQDSDEDEIVLKKKCRTIESDSDDSQGGDHQVMESNGAMSFSDKKVNSDSNRMVLRTRKTKLKCEEDLLLTESDDEAPAKNKKTAKKVLKVAPVFLKSVPKPKPDPEVVEARRQFLLSGVPSSLKKEMEKQQSIEEADLEVFPLVSHIQQETSENTFWNLPKADLQNLVNCEPIKLEVSSFVLVAPSEETVTELINYDCIVSNRLRNHKKIIREIKSKNPNYPVYKIFKSLYKRSGYKVEKDKTKHEMHKLEPTVSTPKRRGRKKKHLVDKSMKIADQVPLLKSEEEFPSGIMWIEKYKALTSSDIIGNHGCVASLKEWLTKWLNTSNEERNKKCCDDSESEFDCIDGDSRDSTKLFGNALILRGPVGCGKTTAVYAVCSELGFNVLEVNASSKRTGKRLLQELHEATQSHQVRKEETLLTFFKQENEKLLKHKMCVLLVEDVDIVFEQDEGFNAALTQIITTSKRPIILTTTDECAPSVQKFLSDRQTISFSPLSSVLTIWLQIVCLIEGCYVSVKSLRELLEYNNGDIRRTLLELQFFVISGGGYKEQSRDKSEIREAVTDCDLVIEDDSNLSDCRINEADESNEDVPLHHICISNFETLRRYKLFSLPCCANLNIIWWNLPKICHLPDFSSHRLHPNSNHSIETFEVANKLKERQKLLDLVNIYDTLAFADSICDRNNRSEDLIERWRTKPKDNLTLEENVDSYDDSSLSDDLRHMLLSTAIKLYKEKYDGTYTSINMAVPSMPERRWYSRQFSNSDKLKEALLSSNCLERNAIELDYMSTLRTIMRFELRRSENNTKRRGRFYNYLRNLGVNAGDPLYKSAWDIFKIRD